MRLFSRLTRRFTSTIGLTVAATVALLALSAGLTRRSVQAASVADPAGAAAAADNGPAIRPFQVQVSDADLADLRRRLLATPGPTRKPVPGRLQR